LVWWALAAHVFIPLVVGITFTILAAATGPAAASGSEIAAAILSIGATGAIFGDSHLVHLFVNSDADNSGVAGISLIAINLMLSALIIVCRQKIYAKKQSISANRWRAFGALFCGFLTLISITVLIRVGYRDSAKDTQKIMVIPPSAGQQTSPQPTTPSTAK
jgi:disulfide bond formation protein DsbB